MTHIFFIDPLEKLNAQKDSSLYLAMEIKKMGGEVVLLFEGDFFFSNCSKEQPVYDFMVDKESDFNHLKPIHLGQKKIHRWNYGDIFHFRLDPPFDGRYLRYIWMADALKDFGVKVINDPIGIASHNEKLAAYRRSNSHPSYVGASIQGAHLFIHNLLDQGRNDFIFKPLDLFQGYGVTKVSLIGKEDNSWVEIFSQMITANKGAIVIQPFISAVDLGEIRSIFWQGRELASILKVPQKGSFMANIAQGASYKQYVMEPKLTKECREVSQQLLKENIPWVAFDILDEKISEVNITCPGLLVECARASQKNLAKEIALDLLS